MRQMRYVLYLRVSTEGKGQDTVNQRLQLEEYAKKSDWKVVSVYEDYASGKSGDRDQFKQLLKDAAGKKFDGVLFWSLDRFSREGTLPTLQYLDTLSKFGVAYVSFTEPYLDSSGPLGDVIIALLATIAKQERIRISERTKAGLQAHIAKGIAGPNGQIGPGRRRKPLDVVELRRYQEAKLSDRDIAYALGVSPNHVKNEFIRLGLRDNVGQDGDLEVLNIEELKQLKDAGNSNAMIARYLKVSTTTVRRAVIRHGLRK